MATYDYDLIILGGGSAGITAAMVAQGLGKRALLTDRGPFGGECTWSGCVPSKSLIRAAAVAHDGVRAPLLGLAAGGALRPGPGVLAAVRAVSEDIYRDENTEHFRSLGVDALERVEARFVDERTVEVGGDRRRRLTARRFIIATGSRPALPPVPGLDAVPYLTNETVFAQKTIPSSLVVMGGGPIGVELAQAFGRLGSRVTIVEMAPRILPREDREMSGLLEGYLRDEGIAVMTAARVTGIARRRGGVRLTLEGPRGTASLDGAALLVAAGRRPNIEDLNLAAAGVEAGPGGIRVDARLRTTNRAIYAAGDVVGPYQFSHVANRQAQVAATNALLPLRRAMRYDAVPWVTFTEPELARSGLTEDEARERLGASLRIYRTAIADLDRARTDRDRRGLAKALCDRRGRIVGIHILGSRAGEVLHEPHAARSLGIPLKRLYGVMHAYPTYSDAVARLARDAYLDGLRNHPAVRLVNRLRGRS